MDLIQKIKELIELYDEYGSEMPEVEVNFLKLLVSKAATEKGLELERLDQDTLNRINILHDKYSKLESFDSDETDGKVGR